MWRFNNTRDQDIKRRPLRYVLILSVYEDSDSNIFFKLNDGSKTKRHAVAKVKEQCKQREDDELLEMEHTTYWLYKCQRCPYVLKENLHISRKGDNT